MNIWFISDTHFGFKNDSKTWENRFKDCFDNFVFPLFEEGAEYGDILIHCGDVFDNRKAVGLSTLNFAMGVFERLGTMFSKVFVLCGNHDMHDTNSNDICSVDFFKHIPNVKVVKTPSMFDYGGLKIGLVPWITDTSVLSSELRKMRGADFVACHADFNGVVMNASNTKSESELKAEEAGLSCPIYSGHIHHRQKYKNIRYIGSPYQMSQSDRGNDRGVLRLSANGDETFYKNELSPTFERISYDEIKELTMGEFKAFCKNKHLDVIVDAYLLSKCRFPNLYAYIDTHSDTYNINLIPEKDTGVQPSAPKISMSECVSIEEMLDKYIDNVLEYDDKLKANLKKITKKLINGQ